MAPSHSDIGRLLAVCNERGAQFIGTLLGFNERGDAFINVSAINLGEKWERLPKTEMQAVIGAVEVEGDDVD